MQKSRITAVLDGVEEPLSVVIDGRDIRAWEGRHDASFITTDMSYTALTEMAATAAIRAGQYKNGFDRFMEECISVEQEAETPPRPTKKGRTGA